MIRVGLKAPEERVVSSANRPLLDGLAVSFERARAVDEGAVKPPVAKVAGVPVAWARASRFTGVREEERARHRAIDVGFGALTREQFDSLREELGGQSRVPYVAGRDYSIVDFLPPGMQALLNQDVDCPPPVMLEGEGLPPGGVSIEIAPNCHGTAWEMARAYQGQLNGEVWVYCGGEAAVASAFDAKGAFKTIPPPTPYRTDRFLGSLRPGDLVSLYHPASFTPSVAQRSRGDARHPLLHTAVYVGAGLFFDGATPYRLATLDLMLASNAEGLRGQKPRFVARRPTRPLPPPQVAFSSAESEQVAAWAKRQGLELGRPILGTGQGGTPTAAVTRRFELGADGRGMLR